MMSRRFSQDEARQIFANAAERQQSRKREESVALTLAELEEAGAAAGIDAEFVRAAAADVLRPERESLTRPRTSVGTVTNPGGKGAVRNACGFHDSGGVDDQYGGHS